MNVPEAVPFLGIPKGRIDIQRLFLLVRDENLLSFRLDGRRNEPCEFRLVLSVQLLEANSEGRDSMVRGDGVADPENGRGVCGHYGRGGEGVMRFRQGRALSLLGRKSLHARVG